MMPCCVQEAAAQLDRLEIQAAKDSREEQVTQLWWSKYRIASTLTQ